MSQRYGRQAERAVFGPVRYLADKVCPQCAMTFRPRKARSIFCGQSCRTEARQPNQPLTWRPNHDGYLVGEMCVYGKRISVMQHRWVMERVLGRALVRGEVVHHRNQIRADNRPENLELRLRREHAAAHSRLRHLGGYSQKLTADQRQAMADRMRRSQPWRYSARYRNAHPEEN